MSFESAKQQDYAGAGDAMNASASDMADELEICGMEADARRLRGMARELEDLARQIESEPGDDEAPHAAQHARTQASAILATADRVDATIRGAAVDARGRKQISCSRVVMLTTNIRQTEAKAALEKDALVKAHEVVAITHEKTESILHAPVQAVKAMAAALTPSVRVAPPPVVRSAARVATVASIMPDLSEIPVHGWSERGQYMAHEVMGTIESGYRHAVQDLRIAERYEQVAQWGRESVGRVRHAVRAAADTGAEIYDSVATSMGELVSHPLEYTKRAVTIAGDMVRDTRVYQVADRYVMQPVAKLREKAVEKTVVAMEYVAERYDHGVVVAKRTLALAKQQVVAVKDRAVALLDDTVAGGKMLVTDAKDAVLGAPKRLMALLPSWGEAAPVVAKVEPKPVAVVKPKPAPSLTDQALSMARKAAAVLPLAWMQTMTVADHTTVSHPNLPSITPIIGSFLGWR